MKLTLEIVGNMVGRNRRHECEALGLREFGGGRLQLFAGKIFKKIDVDPVLVPLGGKEITLDAAACGDIGIATDEPRLGIVRLNRPVADRTPAVVGLLDRKSRVSGKSVSVRVGLGGGRLITNTK